MQRACLILSFSAESGTIRPYIIMVTSELKTLVLRRLAQNEVPETIASDLLRAGWCHRDIESALQEKATPTSAEYEQSTGPLNELWIAALLTAPLLGLPLLAGTGFYSGFWWQLTCAAVIGGLLDTAYFLTVRKLLTPVLHPNRLRLRWLIAGPPLALLLLWALHVHLIAGATVALLLGLTASLIMGRLLIWDSIASSIGFGLLYVALYVSLNVPVAGLIRSFSGVLLLAHPIEEVLLVFLYGALFGPLCAAFRLKPVRSAAFHPRQQRGKHLLIAVFALFVTVTGYGIYDRFVRLPAAVGATPAKDSISAGLTSPISITFDRPLDRRRLSVELTPPIDGDLSFSDPYLQRTFVQRLIFTPKRHLDPGTRYVLKVSDLKNVLGRQGSVYSLAFTTPALPSVASVSLKNRQGDVAICTPIIVKLDQPAGKLAEFSFELTPPTQLTSTVSDGTTYTLTPTGCLNQSTAYSLAIKRLLTIYGDSGSLRNSGDQAVTVATVAFTSKGAPGISGFSPQGSNVLATTKQITLSFSEAMTTSDPTADLTLSPATPGSWHWTDSRTLSYALVGNLPLDTSFTLTVKRGLKDLRGGYLPQDAAYSFSTVGHVRISSISPGEGSSGVAVDTPIRIAFDQPVDHPSAEQRFSISPSATGSFSWQGQTMLYSANLDRDGQYEVSEGSGVVSSIGLPSAGGASSGFQTEESVFSLNIPQYYQQHTLSCEAASLTMALKYRGVGIDENSILSLLGDDVTPRQGNVWGDPYAAFVGDVNGHQDTTGYGVYSGPVVAAANKYRSAQAMSGLGAAQAATLISGGNPIVFWGTAGNARFDPWVTPGGRQINAYIGEHVRLLIGYTGPAGRPTGFIINDPIFGRLHWSANQLTANMSAFGGMGVAIY